MAFQANAFLVDINENGGIEFVMAEKLLKMRR